MLPDWVSNPGPLTYESGAYRLRYAARQEYESLNTFIVDLINFASKSQLL